MAEAAGTVFTVGGIQLYQTLNSLKHQNYTADKPEVIVVICDRRKNEKESLLRDDLDFISAKTNDRGLFLVENSVGRKGSRRCVSTGGKRLYLQPELACGD